MQWRLDPGQIEVVDDAVADILRKKQPWERVEMMLEANETMRLLLEAHFIRNHPDWRNEEVGQAIARRLMGE